MENGSLSNEIKIKKAQVADLAQLEAKHRAVSASLAETEVKLEQRRKQEKVIDSFTGLIDHPSFEELQEFASSVPYLIEQAKRRKEPPELLRNYAFDKITAGKLKPQKCMLCHATFAVDKPAKRSSGYHCPVCASTFLQKIVTEDSIIPKEAFAEPKVLKKLEVPASTEHQKTNQNDKPSA
jgi:DNA-directed RNA polymerase subunit RPC12/RpoP